MVVVIGVVLMVGILALLNVWQRRVAARTDALSAELRQSQTQWMTVSATLDEARKAGVRFDAFSEQAARVIKECEQPAWSPALQAIVAFTGENIRLQDVRAHRASDDSGAWSIRVAGVASGAAPRSEADAFRQKMQREIEKAFATPVSARLEQLDELPDVKTRFPGVPPAAFSIVATIGEP